VVCGIAEAFGLPQSPRPIFGPGSQPRAGRPLT